MPALVETINKVEEFENLPAGWHFGEGSAPTDTKIKQSVSILRTAHSYGVTRMNAFPGIDGEILLAFYHDDNTLEFTLEIDGDITIAEDEGNNQVSFREGATEHQALAKLAEFGQKVCDSSELYTATTTIPTAATSKVLHSSSQATVAFQLLSATVPLDQVRRSASTWTRTMRGKWVTPPSTGTSQLRKSPLLAASSKYLVPQATNATTTFTSGLKGRHGRSSLV